MTAEQEFAATLRKLCLQAQCALKLVESGPMRLMSEQQRREDEAKYGVGAFCVGDFVIKRRV